MSDSIELHVEPRSDLGKGASRRLRREADLVPAIIYGAGKDPVSITIPHKDLYKACEEESFFAQIVKVNVAGGDVDNVIVKALQRHPAKDRIMHADFLRVRMDEAITVEVSFHFMNEDSCPGVKIEGGMASHAMSYVEIECLPGSLPEYIEVDVAALNLGDSIHLSEVVLPEGVTIPALALGEDHDQVVVSIAASRATVESGDEESAEEGGEAAAAKPEDKSED